MKRWWRREVLRFVDAWACREGTPEDDEDAKAHAQRGGGESSAGPGRGRDGGGCDCGVLSGGSSGSDGCVRGRCWSSSGMGNGDIDVVRSAGEDEWIELGIRGSGNVDEEVGKGVGRSDKSVVR